MCVVDDTLYESNCVYIEKFWLIFGEVFDEVEYFLKMFKLDVLDNGLNNFKEFLVGLDGFLD